MEKTFSQWKKQCLNRLDLSKKGGVDEDIVHVVSLLNDREQYFTTSSCSGRIIVVDGASDGCGVQKQNCVWLFVSHRKCAGDDLMSALDGSKGDAVLKFEPFVLHAQCRRLEDAQLLHSVAINSGFRNSGLTASKTGKIITAVRCTHGLEVPLSHQGRLLVPRDYIDFLTRIANQKMEENLRRIHRFYHNLQTALATQKPQKPQIPEPLSSRELQDPCQSLETQERDREKDEEEQKREKSSVYKRRRKRGQQQQTDGRRGDRGGGLLELEDCLDLFT